METKLDRYGRVVIPKKVRDDLGLAPGDRLEIREGQGEIVLKPVSEDGHLVYKDGILVFTGTIEGDILDVIRADREERDRHVSGFGKK